MPPNATKRRKGSRIAGAKREAVLSAIAAGGSDTAIGKQLGVDREAVTGIRASEDGQRVLEKVRLTGEQYRQRSAEMAGELLLRVWERMLAEVGGIDPESLPGFAREARTVVHPAKVEHTGANGEALFQKYQQMPLDQLREEMRKRLAEPKAQDENMPDE